ncbi:hypothetical protein GCM10016455_05800 [Aliiroseovarius zhejiangensis]|uniref:Uncharacterized protein n=1 Tax=Aliiroseovarius zhejiangensis TaxID=1632025 RepID=A0ABQ3IN61_9RHOB|nr:hypothetical protein [Aliiroseovarius zhejiangensis]GHE88509.1 hypothetical protein GCM10016455_05800 [Aliiroseovarius zhejiangensis]
MRGLKEAAIKAAIVLTPSYTAAYLTEQMVYVVPTLAAAGFFASSIVVDDRPTTRQVDEDGEGGEEGDSLEADFIPSDGDGI